jgi:hypothetical protein
MMFREKLAAYCENHMKHTSTVFGKKQSFSILKHAVNIVTAEVQRVK